MNPVRVLLCDDSSVVRRLIKTAIKSVNEVEIIGEANNGHDGIEKTCELKPDVIIMDVEMPIMDGIDAVRILRRKGIKTPVIMFSSLTSRGAEATLDAMEAGANDIATKPTKSGHVSHALDHVRNELVPLLIRWGRSSASRRMTSAPKPAAPKAPEIQPAPTPEAKAPEIKAPKPASAPGSPATSDMDRMNRSRTLHLGAITAVGIGVSTGGPAALTELFKTLPETFPVPILIVQHMPPVFTKRLAERLSKIKGHNVREAVDGDFLVPDEVLIAPGDYHMTINRVGADVSVSLDQSPKINSCRPAVDPLFSSLARHLGRKSLGVIMTGMGQDGLDGVRDMKKKGSKIIVQDEASSVVWGMPGAVANAGLADHIVNIEQIAEQIVRTVGIMQPSTV